MSRHDLTDEQWRVLEPLLPPVKEGRGRPRTDNRKCLNGILYVLKTGIPWADLPTEYGSPLTSLATLRRMVQSRRLGPYLARPTLDARPGRQN